MSPSGFYASCQRPASSRAQRNRRLEVLVRASFEASRYGSPRIHADLLEQDERVSRKRVIRLMQEEGLKARVRKRLHMYDDERSRSGRQRLGGPVHGGGPNQRWVGDTTD